jgi:tetratricopeptide (TPR) repeat protein
LDDGRTYVGVFGLFFLVTSRGVASDDPDNGRGTVDDAAEKIVQRAVKAKASSDYSTAGSLYLEAANLLRRNELMHEAGENFEAAYKAFQHVKEFDRAKQALLLASDSFKEDQRTLSRAARGLENLSSLQRKDGNIDKALEHLVEAQSCYERAEDARALGISMNVAELMAKAGDYSGAAERFQECASKVADDSLAFRLPNLLLDSSLCAMALDSVAFSRTVNSLMERFPRFAGSSAGLAAKDLAVSLNSHDLDAFERTRTINGALLSGWRKGILDNQRKALESDSIT